jgi:hypothetical protein
MSFKIHLNYCGLSTDYDVGEYVNKRITHNKLQ